MDLFEAAAPAPAPAVGERTARRRAQQAEASRRYRAKKRGEAERLPESEPTDPICPDVDVVIKFLEGLTLSQGRRDGEKLTLLPWQRQFLAGALAPGSYQAALTMGRGGGKTTFMAAVLCAYLAGPLRQSRAEVVLVASSFGQARIAFEHALEFMRPALAANDAAKVWRVENSSQRAAITHRTTGARVRCLASDPRRVHGLAPVLAIADEPSQWPENTAGRMVSVLETSTGKIPGARIWMIGTRPLDPEHFFERALAGGPGQFAMRFEADPEADPSDPEQWSRANPSLDAMPDLRAIYAAQAEAARADPRRMPAFRALRLNLGEADESTAVLLDADVWERIERAESERRGDLVWGLDLGGGSAMSAAAGYWMESGRLTSLAFFPGSPGLKERGKTDGVGDLYLRMAERGELMLSGTHAVELPEVLAMLRRQWGRPTAIVADKWRADLLREALARARIEVCPLVLRAQGYRDGSQDLEAFRGACMADEVHPVPSLLLRAAMHEARVSVNSGGHSKLAKSTQGGRRSKARDDSIAAAILAVAEGKRERERRAARAARTARAAA